MSLPLQRKIIKNSRGFTLIEVMIVIAIIGILASFAIPSYRNYVIQANMAEAMAFAAKMKTDATMYYATNRRFPHDGGMNNREIINADVVYAVEHWGPSSANGQETHLHVYLQPDVFPGATRNHALIFEGTVRGSTVIWNCRPHESFRAIPNEYVPSECHD